MTGLTTEQMIDELESCNKKIENITGKCPTLFRPPYGDYDNRVVETVESIDMYTIQWDCDVSATVEKAHKYKACEDSKLQKIDKI